jgi:hypothetical protein
MPARAGLTSRARPRRRYQCTECHESFCGAHARDTWLSDDEDEDEAGAEPAAPPPGETAGAPLGLLANVLGRRAAARKVRPVAPPPRSPPVWAALRRARAQAKARPRLLCVECFAPRRMAALQHELHAALDALPLDAPLPPPRAAPRRARAPPDASGGPAAPPSGARGVVGAVSSQVGSAVRTPSHARHPHCSRPRGRGCGGAPRTTAKTGCLRCSRGARPAPRLRRRGGGAAGRRGRRSRLACPAHSAAYPAHSAGAARCSAPP